MPYTAGTVFLEVAPSFDGIQDEARRQVRRAFSDLDKQVAPGLAKAEKAAKESGERTGKNYGSAMERIIKTRMKAMQETISALNTGSLRGEFRALRREMEGIGKLDLGKLTDQNKAIASIEGMRGSINRVFKDVENGSRTASTAALTNLGALRNSIESIQKDTSKWLVGGDPNMQEAAQRRMATLQMQAQREMTAEFAKREQSERQLANDQVKAFREMTAETKNREQIERSLAELQMRAAREMEAEFAKRESGVRRMANLQLAAAREEAAVRRQINTEQARAAHENLRLDIDELKRDVKVGVVGADEARVRLIALTRVAERLDRMSVRPDVDVPSQTGNIIQMRALAQAIDDVGNEARKTGVWMKALDAGSAANSVRVFNGALFTTLAIGPLLIPILGGIGAGIIGIGVAAAGALLGVGALALGLSGIGGAVGAMNDLSKQQRTAGSPREEANRAARVRRDNAAIADAERSLTRTVRDARNSQADSARAVADAERDLSRARVEAQKDQVEAAKRIREAEEGLTEAREDATRTVADAARRTAEAEVALADAREASTRSVADAARRTADAEQAVRDAQERSLEAQLDINEARRQAVRDLQDMNFQLRGARLSEQEAAMAVQEAAARYSELLEDDQATAREKDKGRIDMEQAQLAYEQAQTNTKRLTKDTAEANKKGVEGSDLVTAAKESERDAVKAVADAQVALKDARVNEAEVAEDAARRVQDARTSLRDAHVAEAEAAEDASERVQDAQNAIAEARIDAADSATQSAQRISDAERGVADAQRVAAEQRVASAEAIADAQRAVQTANQAAAEGAVAATAAAGGLATATDNLALAMANLSPAGRAFATFLYGLKPLLDDLRWSAQENFLPGLQQGMQMMVDTYGPGLVRFVGAMSKVLGDLAVQAAEMFTSPFWKDFFGYMAEVAPIFLEQFGQIGLNLLSFVAGITKAFAPLGLEIGEWLTSITGSMATWAQNLADSEGFAKFTEWLDRIKPKVLELFALAFETLVTLLIGLAPYAERLLDFFINLFEGLSTMTPDELADLAISLGGIALAIQAIAGALGLIAGIAGLFSSIGMLGTMFKGLGTAMGTVVTALFGGGAGAGAATAAGAAGRGGGAAVAGAVGKQVAGRGIIAGISALAGGPVGIAIGVVLALATAFQLAYEHITPFREAVDGLVAWMGGAFEGLWLTYLQPFFHNVTAGWNWLQREVIGPFVAWIWRLWTESLQPAFEYLYDNAIKPTMDLIGAIFEVVWGIIETFGHIISEIFEHIIAPVFQWLYEEIIAPVMRQIGNAVEWVWYRVLKPVFTVLGAFIEEHIAPAWRRGVEIITDIWAGILDLIRTPIRGVIDLVINRGLIGGFNWLADRTGMDKLDPIPIPTALLPGGRKINSTSGSRGSGGGRGISRAGGGVLPGFTPGRDVHDFYSPTAGSIHLSGGEGILRPELVQAIGSDRFNAANKAAREGKVSEGLTSLGGFASGGILPSLGGFAKGGILEDLIARVGGGLSTIMAGPAKWLKGILNGAIGKGGFASVPKALAKMAGGKAVSGLASMIQGAFSSGGEGGPGGSNSRLMAALRWWQDLGARVSEHPAFGGVRYGHMKGSMHYLGRAGDLNYATTGPSEMRFFDKHLPTFRKLFPDMHTLWRVAGHYNHMHIDNSRGDGGGFVGSAGAVGTGPAAAQVRGVAQQYGWGSGPQWEALSWLINKESSWNPNAANPTSSARGLFQKMTSIHGPVESTPAGQAQWGLNYIKNRYGTPANAKQFHMQNNYYEEGGILPKLYDQGGDLPPGLSLVANKTSKPEGILTNEMMTEVRERRGGDFIVDMKGSNFGYDPDDVAAAISRRRSDELALAGIDDGGDVW